MIDYDTFCKIRHCHDRQGLTIAQIARTLSLDQRTVAKWLARPRFEPRRSRPRSSVLDPFKPRIIRLLDRHPYSAQQIFQRLREEGYRGGITILRDLMFAEFAKIQVLPLDASASTRFVTPHPSPAAGRKHFTYSGSTVSIPNGNQPSLLNTSYTITADVEIAETRMLGIGALQSEAEGVIVGEGGRFVGYALYLKKDKPVFTYDLMDLKRTRWEGAEALSPGTHTIEFDLKYDGLGPATLVYDGLSGVGRGGTGTLKLDGKVVSSEKLERTVLLSLLLGQRFFIGTGGPSPVDDRDYHGPFKFTGKINKLERKLQEASRAAHDAR